MQCSTGNCSRDGSTQAPTTADGSKESNVRTERVTGLYTSRETVVGEKEHDCELVRHVPPAQCASHPENENESVKKGDREHLHERLPCAESPTRTPQTGDEDTADVQSLSTVGKQSSPGSFDILASLRFFSHYLIISVRCHWQRASGTKETTGILTQAMVISTIYRSTHWMAHVRSVL